MSDACSSCADLQSHLDALRRLHIAHAMDPEERADLQGQVTALHQAIAQIVAEMRRRVSDSDRGPVAEWQVLEWAGRLSSRSAQESQS